MCTSSYKSIGGDGRGGKAGDGCHYCSHSNDQTGESCRRKHIVTFNNLLTEKNVQHCYHFSSRPSNYSESSVKSNSTAMKTSCCTEVCHMCHFVVIFHIKVENYRGGEGA